jgi:hypothetical protein
MNKNKYVSCEMEIIEFEQEDVITDSGDGDKDQYELPPVWVDP